MAIDELLPDGSLKRADIEELRSHENITNLEVVLEFQGKILSFTIEVGGNSFGVHSDHDTGEWDIIVRGDDFEQVLEEHQRWLDNDMDRVVG